MVRSRFLSRIKDFSALLRFNRKKSVVGVSPNFMTFFNSNKNSFDFIIKNTLFQKKVKFPIIDKKRKIVISEKSTGKYKGVSGGKRFRIRINGKLLFLRIKYQKRFDISTKDLIDVHEKAANYLKSIGNKIDGFNIFVLQPHVIYQMKGKTIIATDYLKENEVVLVEDIYNLPSSSKYINSISKIKKELYRRGVCEVLPANTFYNEKSNSLILFDLEPTPAGEDL